MVFVRLALTGYRLGNFAAIGREGKKIRLLLSATKGAGSGAGRGALEPAGRAV